MAVFRISGIATFLYIGTIKNSHPYPPVLLRIALYPFFCPLMRYMTAMAASSAQAPKKTLKKFMTIALDSHYVSFDTLTTVTQSTIAI